MGKIVDRVADKFPGLKGAEYLEYETENLPKDVVICKTNVFKDAETDDLLVLKNMSHWGWESPLGYHYSFSTPEEALSHYLLKILETTKE